MPEPASIVVCPHLGPSGARTEITAEPNADDCCFATTPPFVPDPTHRGRYCLSASYAACPFFVAADSLPVYDASRSSIRQTPPLPWIALGVVIVLLAVSYASGVFAAFGLQAPRASSALAALPVAAAQPVKVAAAAGATPAATPQPAATAGATPRPAATAGAMPAATATANTLLVISPVQNEAAWWTSGEPEGSNHVGDSLLYAGYYNGQVFISAFRLRLATVPRGAPIQDASLRLTGLLANHFVAGAGGAWTVELLPEDAMPDFAEANFKTVYAAAAAHVLDPQLHPSDLGVSLANSWRLDAQQQLWLEQQVARGAGSLIVRIVGPKTGGDTLFAWDSGMGQVTKRAGPQLSLEMGPKPAVTPTRAYVVGPWSPAPENVFTAEAVAGTATAVAATTGTYTPQPAYYITATPFPGMLGTALARGYTGEIRPVLIYTPTPGNSATAEFNAVYATAVAVSTGTFTPVPADAVTPVMIMPTPMPDNVLTAAVQVMMATAQAERTGTPTPLPYNALIATMTPTPDVITPTPAPFNTATAEALVAYATAVAMTTGTFTPMPANGVTPTPFPLLIDITPGPGFTPTPATVPQEVAGKILFYSDRGDKDLSNLYAYDPVTGSLAWLWDGMWVYRMALAAESRSPDGRYVAFVQPNPGPKNHDVQRVFVRDTTAAPEASPRMLVAPDRGITYDPVWSPNGDRIAYVSDETGSDEIYVAGVDGSNPQRLTFSSSEWNKHPTWSPDGTQIVFWSSQETGRSQLWIMNADGSDRRPLINSGYNDWDPVWVK